MKFLLVAVNAKYIHSNPAIYSLRACAGEELRQYVELAEYTINQPMEEILADIYERKPDVAGFSCYIWNWRLVRELLTELAKLLPETDIWLGGPEVSWDADEILRKYPQVTGVMVGEGEATFRELLETYVRHGESGDGYGREKIPGLYLRSGATPSRACVKLDDIPFFYHNLAPFENRIIYYESSRGCPFLCSYCLSSLEKQLRFRDINVIKKELQFFLDNKVKQVKFTDRTFNCNHDHAMAVWSYLREHDNGVTNFHFEISADILREDEIELLGEMRPGLVQLEIGVQSVNSETLKAIRRVTELEKLEKIVAAIRKNGNIHQHLDLIAGLPYEDYESFGNSFNRVYHMRPEQLQLGFLKVLKGSEMWEKAEEYGIIYQEQPPYEVLYTRWLTFEDVLKLKGIEEMVELYYNSGQFTHTLSFLEKAFSDPFEMYEAMAEFYREKGYFKASPARGYRYQVLLDFTSKYDEKREAVYRELLTFDMYLREKVKSRPAFAADLSGWREIIHDFYQEEERTRRYLPDYGGYDGKQLSKMTHLEPFVWPVWDRERMTELYESSKAEGGWAEGAGPVFILFNYRKRNPLNHEAETCRVVWDRNPRSLVL